VNRFGDYTLNLNRMTPSPLQAHPDRFLVGYFRLFRLEVEFNQIFNRNDFQLFSRRI
jgi:hypothetical protein